MASRREQLDRTAEPYRLPLEKDLEDLLELHPEIIFDGEPLVVIGRQSSTDLGRVVDLLAVDAQGRLVVAELKKGRTPRDVVAQSLEYASYAASLRYAGIDELAAEYLRERSRRLDVDRDVGAVATLAEAFQRAFPETAGESISESIAWNGAQRIAIVSEDISPDIASVCRYLRLHGLDISAIQVSLLQSSTGERIISSQRVVGLEAPANEEQVSVVEVESRVPTEYQQSVAAIRQAMTERFKLRERVTASGFGFEPRPNPRALVLAGLYLSKGGKRPTFYVFRRASDERSADVQGFYVSVRDDGFETTGLPENAIAVPSHLSRTEKLLSLFAKYIGNVIDDLKRSQPLQVG